MRRFLNNIYLFWTILALPAAFMIARLVSSGFDPAVAFDLEHGSGEMSVRMAIMAMAISPLIEIFGRKGWTGWLLARRRSLGVAAFGYGALHLIVYLIDFEAFSGGWSDVLEDATNLGIWTGYAALAIFTAMAITSNNTAQKAMRANWKRLQRLVYPAMLLVFLHWVYVDNEWPGAMVHFIPLIILEAVRFVLIYRKGRFKLSSANRSQI